MKNNEYDTFEKSLFDKGYKRYNGSYHVNDDYYLYKTLIYKTDEDGNETGEIMLSFSVWNWSNFPVIHDHDPYGIEATILLSRDYDERIELSFGEEEVKNLGVDEIENIARKFHKFSEKHIKVTRG